MKYEDGTVVEHFASAQGTKQLEIIKRHDGAYRFVEWTLDNDEYAGEFWNPTRHSGLFSDADLAKIEAQADLVWFREAMPPDDI